MDVPADTSPISPRECHARRAAHSIHRPGPRAFPPARAGPDCRRLDSPLARRLVDTSASMQIRDPRLDAPEQKRAAIARGSLDPQKGMSQSLIAQRLASLSRSRIDLAKAVLKNERLNLLPRFDRDFDLAAFTFGPHGEISARREQRGTNSADRKRFQLRTSLGGSTAGAKPPPPSATRSAMSSLASAANRWPACCWLPMARTTPAPSHWRAPRPCGRKACPFTSTALASHRRATSSSPIFSRRTLRSLKTAPVTVRVRAGLKNETADVVLKLGDQTVATKTVTFAGDSEQVVPLKFTPQAQGDFELRGIHRTAKRRGR